MTRTLRRSAPVALGIWLLGFGVWDFASAHHSQSEFDSRAKVEVEGTVTKLEWKSPHAWVYLDVTSDKGANNKGEIVNWSFELPSPVTLMRRGWTRDSLKPGDRIKVSGARAKNFPAIGLANTIKDSNGKPVFTGVTQIYEPEAESKESR
jgi:Family of unknown function (DUF6152)